MQDTKELALEYLTGHPFDVNGLADYLNMSVTEVEALMEDHALEFREVEERHLNEMERLVYLAGLGQLPPEHSDFNAGVAEKFLRAKRWSKKASVRQPVDKKTTAQQQLASRLRLGAQKYVEKYEQARASGASIPTRASEG